MITPVDLIRILAKAFARACRQDFVEDENGEPVRRRHAIREFRGERQLTLWQKMEDLTPEKMKGSLQSRKNGSIQDVLQIERDRRFYNNHYNPGDPIEMDFNLNLDIEEHYLSDGYPDSPPEESSDDEE